MLDTANPLDTIKQQQWPKLLSSDDESFNHNKA